VSQQPSTASKTITPSRQAAKEAREYIVSVSLEFEGAPLVKK